MRIYVSREDMEAARLLGLGGTGAIEHSINRALDKLYVPREGRHVVVSSDELTIELPAGIQVTSLCIDVEPVGARTTVHLTRSADIRG